MKQYFYAYHGPRNDRDFDYLGGWGVAQEHRRNQTREGDFVFVIQKRPEKQYYELCGLYSIESYYYDPGSPRLYRMKLTDYSNLKSRIRIDEEECSKKLPQIVGDSRWTNFKLYFCRQGVSFQGPLKTEVVKVLCELFPSNVAERCGNISDIDAHEEQFLKKIKEASTLSEEQLREKIAAASKVPSSVVVTTTVFERNSYVAALVLKKAGGKCQLCGNPAPFHRRSNGAPYLEVHHKVRLADGGEDTVENVIALCPNCHRKEHYGA